MGSGLVYRSGLLTGVLAQLLQLSGGRISMWSHRVTGHSADRARDLQTAAWCEQHGVVWHQVATGGVFAGSTMTRFEDWQERWQPLFVNYGGLEVLMMRVKEEFQPLDSSEYFKDEKRIKKAVDVAMKPI